MEGFVTDDRFGFDDMESKGYTVSLSYRSCVVVDIARTGTGKFRQDFLAKTSLKELVGLRIVENAPRNSMGFEYKFWV